MKKISIFISIFYVFLSSEIYPQSHSYNNPYGMNAWNFRLPLVQDWANAHIKSLRIMCHWRGTEPQDNQYNWSGSPGLIDAVVTAPQVGAKLSLCVYDSPDWARSDINKALSCSTTKYCEFIVALLDYCENQSPGVVEAVEIMNEEGTQEDMNSVDRDPSWFYGKLLKAAYNTIKNYNQQKGKNILCVGGAIWSGAFHHLDELYQLGYKGYFDRINFHYYVHPGIPEAPDDKSSIWHLPTSLLYMKKIADEYGDTGRLIWVTEFGWRVDQFGWPGDTGEITKANYVKKTLEICNKCGFVDKTHMYVGAGGGYPNNHDTIALVYCDDELNPSFIIHTTAYFAYKDYGDIYPSWTLNEPLDVPLPPTKGVYVINPGLETGDGTGWQDYGVIDSSVSHTGKYSAKKVVPGMLKIDWTPLESGRLYDIIAWIKIEATNGSDSCRVYPAVYLASNNSGADLDCWNPPNYYGIVDTKYYPGGWRKLRFPFLMPENKTHVIVQYECFHQGASGTFWIDDIEIRPLDFYKPDAAYLAVNTDYLDFKEIKVGQAKTMVFHLINAGNGVLTGTISSNKNWIKVEPSNISLAGGTVGQAGIYVNVTVDNSIYMQTAGEFSGKIDIVTNGGSHTINLNFSATCILAKPNPCAPTQKNPLIFYGTGIVPGKTKIKIFSITGELIREIPVSDKSEIEWNGEDSSGSLVVSGIYIYTYESPVEKGVGKITLIR